MKIKSILLMVVLLFTLLSVSTIYADTVHMGNSTFSIPDGYTITESDNNLVIYNDDLAIVMYQGPIIDPSVAKQKRIDMGYDFLGEDTYVFEGTRINQQNYNNGGINTCVYTFKKNNKTYIITLNVDENADIPSYQDNPVTEIIHTLK